MKGILSYFLIGMLSAPAAFAADGTISRALPTALLNQTDNATTNAPTTARTTAARTNVTATTTNTARTTTASRAAPAAAARDGATTVRNTGTGRGTLGHNNDTPSVRDTLNATVNTVGRNARVMSASMNNNPILRRAGITVRPSVAEVGGRATIGDTNQYTGTNIGKSGDNIRNVTSRAATSTVATADAIASAKERLEATAELNKSCQEQYNECMDQFCAVVDTNQKRCSCSANLARYTKVEQAVKDANTQLNEVAQRIRYIGLSADEISAIMSATEAEEALTGTKDTTESRKMLADIANMIKDPTGSKSYSSDQYSDWNFEFDFSNTEFSDLFSLDFLNNSSKSLASMRGTDLYNAAKQRCSTILTQCKDVGATSQQITGNYDLAIDKDCIAYEQGLNKMNETLLSNVRSANLMLQNARRAVLENKNLYDAKECIGALDACMTDEMVCGENYTKCLDPTKRYIDENGNVVLGQNISNIRDFMKHYNNANINQTFLTNANNINSISTATCAAQKDSDDTLGNGACNVKYLLTKIGTGQKVTDGGLCRAVLDKCQRYTYDSNGNYKRFNDVVINYVQRAMVNIKAAQEKIISDYASTCVSDIATCYNQQVTQVNAWSSSASITSIYNVMRGACRNVALTCAYAVFDEATVIQNTPECADNPDNCPYTTVCDENKQDECINQISEIFYQSLLCPENSTYDITGQTHDIAPNGTLSEYTNARCKCNTGYQVYNGYCYLKCENNMELNASGVCVCIDGYAKNTDGVCAPATQQP